MSWSDTAQVYKQRKPREGQLWQLFNEYFDEFEERYDEFFSKKYGFYRPVISLVARKFLECENLHLGLLKFVVRIVIMNIFLPSHIAADGFALHATQKK